MLLKYRLSESCMRRVFVDTGVQLNPDQEIEIDPQELTPEQRALIARVGHDGVSSAVLLKVPQLGQFRYGEPSTTLVLDQVQGNAHDLLAAYESARERGQAEIRADQDRRIDEEIQRYLGWQSDSIPGINLSDYKEHPRREEWLAAVETAKQRAHDRRERENAAREEREAMAEHQRAALVEEKHVWIADHGSAYLRRACLEGGYNCQRLYVLERAAYEHPGYAVDFNDSANWRNRACPSEPALDEALRVGGKVVWLTEAPSDRVESDESDDTDDYAGMYDSPFEPREAIVIREFLGKYDLVRMM